MGTTLRSTRGPIVRCLVVTLTLLCGSERCRTQEAQPRADAAGTRPWLWLDDKLKPFQAWHEDASLQRQVYEEAYAQMRTDVGIDLAEPIQVCIVPARLFPFCGMEFGAKTGTLRHGFLEKRAAEWLGLRSAADRQRAIEPSAIPARGAYYPRLPSLSFAGQIWLLADLTSEQLAEPLRHELVHAMQDRKYSFAQWETGEELDLDGFVARMAVMEGSAMLIANPEELADGTDCLTAGDWQARALSFTHNVGGRVVGGLHGRAGSHPGLLDLVFEHPPQSTRQVLHPELYAAFLDGTAQPPMPDQLFAPTLSRLEAAMKSSGAVPGKRTRTGEFFLASLLVELGTDAVEAAQLAGHWRDDQLVATGGWDDVVVVASVWCLDTDAEAARLMAALEAGLTRRHLVAPAETHEGTHGVGPWSAPENDELPQALLVQRGPLVIYAAGPDLRLLAAEWSREG